MANRAEKTVLKPLDWIGSSKTDLVEFPESLRKEFGHSLHLVQAGETPRSAKPLRGFGGAGVLELRENHQGETYRAVYTVKFAKAVYVLHAFQKKSKRGIATPKPDLDIIKQRLKIAAENYQRKYGG